MPTCPTCRTQYPEGAVSCEKDGETLLPDIAMAGLERELVSGQMVGEYRIESKIGEGGFGSVYRAVHPLIGKTAAVKVLSRQYSSNPLVVSRFVAEARVVNQIRHRNIIDIFAFGALDDGRQYFVMELLDGMPLDQYLNEVKGRLTPEEAIPILRGIGRALDAAHAAGVFHRDLKPANIFLSFDEDGQPFPKLLDFGIAKLASGRAGNASDAKTRTGTPLGTPYYMSPEQCRGKSIDHRTDIYSFGVLCHELLTGVVPFDGEDVMELLMKQTSAPPPPMSSACRAVPRLLDAPVLQMLAKDPAARPASAGAAVEALARAAKEAGFSVSGPAPVAAALLSDRSAPGPNTLGNAPTLDGPPSSGVQGKPPSSGPVISASMASISAEGLGSISSQAVAGPIASKPHGATIGAAAADVQTTGAEKKKPSKVGVGVAGALVLAAAVALASRMGGGSHDAKDTVARLPAVSAPAASAPAVPAPSAAEPPKPAASAAPAEVALTLRTTPARTSVWRDGTKMGDAPGPVMLPRADRTVKLVVKADGYKPAEIDVDTKEDTTVVLSLGKASRPAQRAARPDVKGEIPTDINEK